MSAVTCPNCSTPAPAGAIFCDNCGYDLRNVAPAAPPGQAAPPPPAMPQPAAGIVCPNCHSPNIAGALFCENCGSQLSQPQAAPPPLAQRPPPAWQPQPAAPAYQPPAAPQPQPAYTPPAPPPPPPAVSAASTAAAIAAITGRLVIQGVNTSLTIPPGKQEVLIGREDPVSGVFPDINLDPYGGQEAGVSRRHARIILQGGKPAIEDLNTVNGTIHNRQRLTPGQPIALNDGDELRLGKMVLNYYAS